MHIFSTSKETSLYAINHAFYTKNTVLSFSSIPALRIRIVFFRTNPNHQHTRIKNYWYNLIYTPTTFSYSTKPPAYKTRHRHIAGSFALYYGLWLDFVIRMVMLIIFRWSLNTDSFNNRSILAIEGDGINLKML